MHKHRGTISLVHKPRKHYVRHKKVTSEGPRRSQLLGELGGSHTDNILPDRRRATTSILPSKRVSCTLWRLHPRPVFFCRHLILDHHHRLISAHHHRLIVDHHSFFFPRNANHGSATRNKLLLRKHTHGSLEPQRATCMRHTKQELEYSENNG